MPHPHGQIYGYSVIPKKIELELENCKKYYEEKHHCLLCDMLKEEQKVGQRVIMENEDFCAVLPFFTECPYTMCMHQSPVNGPDTSVYDHFHIEFFPPMRSRDKQKFNASSETGVWAHCNPTAPEEKAEELRAAYQRFLEKQQER